MPYATANRQNAESVTGFEFMTSRLTSARALGAVKMMAVGLFFLSYLPGAAAQSIVVMVNDYPVTSYDLAQRERFLAMTSGLGERMRERLKSDSTKEAFRAYMTERQPSTREEAQALQKEFVAKLQTEVVANASASMRKKAMDELIEERLMLQAAHDQKIDITDDQVNELLTRMAQGGGEKRTLQEFLASFKAQGINPVTLKERIRAQSAWRELIRRLYGTQVRSAVSTVGSVDADESGGTVVDAEIVKLEISSKGQQAAALRLVEAEEIRKGFSSCGKLGGLLKGRKGVSVQSVKSADIKDFQGDIRAALDKAKPGEMTSAVIKGKTVETVAVCSKKVSAAPKGKQKNAEADKMQEEFQLYSRRHLKDLKDRALLKYPNKSG